MKETIRMIAYARHRRRDDALLPLVRELLEALRDHEGIDLYPPSVRQVGLGLRLIKRYSRMMNDFHQQLCNSLSYTQAQRIFGPRADPVAQHWKTAKLPRKVADLLAAMGLRRSHGS